MGRKDIASTKTVFTMYMLSSVHTAMKVAAKEQGRSVAGLINYILADYLRKNNYMK